MNIPAAYLWGNTIFILFIEPSENMEAKYMKGGFMGLFSNKVLSQSEVLKLEGVQPVKSLLDIKEVWKS